ncbi:malectin domain-containing carbohydrate-binding protein [Maribacter sp.]|nr:malectin domain-containing carbohydrate-binding protein [Maribacter sp.]
MNAHLKIKISFVSLLLSLGFMGCEKESLENENANDLVLKTRLQASNNPVGAYQLRINSGGDQVIYGSETFVADTHFNGSGKTYGNNSIVDIAATDRDDLYLSERSSQTTFGYAIPLENGNYTLMLHFAEIYWGATGGGQGTEAKRVFSVEMEGNSIISDYDINLEVGSMTAVVKTYEVTITDGELNLDFSASVNQPKISAIEILGEAPAVIPENEVEPKTLVRINSGGGTETIDGKEFISDTYAVNGNGHTNGSSQDILDTELDPIYRTERNNGGNGTLSYEIPVAVATNYTIKLHFAEIYFGAEGTGGFDGDAQRVFSVELEGNRILTDYDIKAEVGAMTAIIETFSTDVTDGIINIDFLAVNDQPKISAIEILSDAGEIKKGACDWRDLADANHNHIEGQTATVNGKLYLFGGFDPVVFGDTSSDLTFENNTEIYDPIADSWSDGLPMPIALSHAGMQAVGTDIWLIGGFLGDNGGNGTDAVQIYNTLDGTWRTGPSIPIKSAALAAVLVDSRIHIFGGYSENRINNLDQHYYYDLNNTAAGWQELAPLPTARGHHGGAVVNGIIYAMGGQDGHNETNLGNIAAVEAYDFNTKKWTTDDVAQLPAPRSHFELSTLTHNGKIMIAGGNEGANDILQFDPIANQWSAYCDGLPDAMLTPTMMVSGDRLIISCGGLGNNWNPTKRTRWIPIAD